MIEFTKNKLIDYIFQVNWRTVLFGSLLQISFGLLILRTDFGFQAFSWFGELVTTFINFVDHGVAFLFGDGFREHFVAFKVNHALYVLLSSDNVIPTFV